MANIQEGGSFLLGGGGDGYVHDWQKKLYDNERRFVSHVLAFFAASDGIVNENFGFPGYQIMMYAFYFISQWLLLMRRVLAEISTLKRALSH